MPNKLKSVKQGIIWGGLHSLSLIAIKLIRGGLIPKILPSIVDYGLYSSINYFTRYLQLSDFGAKAFFTKRLPYLYFNSNENDVQDHLNEIFTFTLLSFIGVIGYLGLASYFYNGDEADFYKIALLLLIPATVFLKCRELLLVYANSIQEYKTAGNLRIINDFSSMVSTVIGVYFWGAIGGVSGLLLSEIIMLIVTLFRIQLRFSFIFGKQLFKNLRNYLKLFSINISELINNTIDQTFILFVFSLKEFGIYSIALMVHWIMIAISNVIKTSIVPKVMSYGKGNPERIKEILETVILIFFACSILITPFIQLGLSVVLNFYLDKYLIGISIYFLAIFSGVARALGGIIKDFYIASDKERKYVSIIVIYLCIAVILYSIIYQFGLSLGDAIYFIMIADLIFLLLLFNGLKILNYKHILLVLFFFSVLLLYNWLYIHFEFFSFNYYLLQLTNIGLMCSIGGILLYKNLGIIKKSINAY